MIFSIFHHHQLDQKINNQLDDQLGQQPGHELGHELGQKLGHKLDNQVDQDGHCRVGPCNVDLDLIKLIINLMIKLIINLINKLIINLMIKFKIKFIKMTIAELAHVMQTLGDKLSTDETKVD